MEGQEFLIAILQWSNLVKSALRMGKIPEQPSKVYPLQIVLWNAQYQNKIPQVKGKLKGMKWFIYGNLKPNKKRSKLNGKRSRKKDNMGKGLLWNGKAKIKYLRSASRKL